MLTCTPSFLPTSASALVQATQAAFTELPMPNSASGSLPPMPAMVTTEPLLATEQRPCFARRGAHGRRTSARSRPSSRRRSIREKSPRLVAPALFTRMSSLPNCFFRSATSAAGALASLRSSVENCALRPRLATAAATSFERRFVAAGQHDVAAFGGEAFGDARADAAARSGDERDLAGQVPIP